MAGSIHDHVAQAKQERLQQALEHTEAILNKLITVPALELLQTFPANLWQQLRTAQQQVVLLVCSVSCCLSCTPKLGCCRATLICTKNTTSKKTRCFVLVRRPLALFPSRASLLHVLLLSMQAVSSATQYLDDEVSGVELSTEERHKLTDQLAAAADKKLRDLLQVSSAIVWTGRPSQFPLYLS